MTDPQQLLADYVSHASEAAFREIVDRYMDLVYSTAVRLVGRDTHRAEDVAQIVFVDLARLARKVSGEGLLGGWLHRHTCFVAANVMRGERRRQVRERQFVEMNALNSPASDLVQVAPILDEAINRLRDEDRTAILLRFYEQRDFRSVGEALGLSEDSAQKRVSRALERLHSMLVHQKASLSSPAIAAALASGPVTAAPAGLAATVAGTALASATVGVGTTLTFSKFMTTINQLKLGLAAVFVAGLTSHVVLQRQSQAQLRAKDEMLQQQNVRIANLGAEAERFSRLVAGSAPVGDREKSELARLRAEVTVLRNELIETRKSQTNNAPRFEPAFVGQFREAITNSQAVQYGKALGLAYRMYTADNPEQCVTNLSQIEEYISAVQAVAQQIRDRFEFVNSMSSIGGLTNAAQTIIIREKQSSQGPQGMWLKTYVFADGHVDTQSTLDGMIDSWEQLHGITPREGGPANQ